MNPRRQGFLALTISEGAFEDENECNIALETILRQIERKHINQHIPTCGFAVPSNSAKNTVRCTNWGRIHEPGTTLEPYHIHAVLSTDAFSTTEKIVREYLMKDYGKGKIRHGKTLEKNMFWIDELETPNDVIRWTYYCIGQGLRIRKTTRACNEEFIKYHCLDLILTAEKANKRIGAIQSLFPKHSHLLPEQVYDNLHNKRTQPKRMILDGGVDKTLTIHDSNNFRNNHENLPFLPQNKPNQGYFRTSSTYKDPFSEEALNSNVIRDKRN